MYTIRCAAVALAVLLTGCAMTSHDPALVSRDHSVPHVSTVPGNLGQKVNLFVRQKVAGVLVEEIPQKMDGRVVLFVHGATVPSVPDYDLEYKTYNWMAHLARSGFNT